MTQPICSIADIRAIETHAQSSHTHRVAGSGDGETTLMARAGRAVAALASRVAGDRSKAILVLAGPGNNGGDAYEAAAVLKQQFFRVVLVAVGDPAKLPEDAARARRKWLDAGGEILAEPPPVQGWAMILDGLLGLGLAREPEPAIRALIDYANAQRCPVIAIDVPSGLDAQTGNVPGQAVRATHTLSFIALKPGLLTGGGPDHCGLISVDTLGLDTAGLAKDCGWVADPAHFSALLKPRPRKFHKGDAGSLAVIGGGNGMCGAPLLAGRAALRLGCGRVYVGMLAQDAPGIDFLMPELMLRHPDEVLGLDLDAVVIGPGLGRSERALALLAAIVASELPCVLDADALNLLAEDRDLRQACARRQADTLVTPHPGEAARLLDCSVSDIERDRLEAAGRIAELLGAQVVLKGAGSVIRSGSRLFINRTGNPGMASAGMGDVLAGMLGALLAARLPGDAALVLGTCLHGAAADSLAASGNGPVGLTAGELPDAARRIWNDWLASSGAPGS
jgi:hydroxyethylthiazole kinase-like uncharacterized protein yjeF